MTTTPTIDRLIARATNLGLTVEVEEDFEYGVQGITLTVRRPRVDPPQNMLDVYNNSRQIVIYANRYGKQGRWSHHAHRFSRVTNNDSKMKLSTAPYAIDGLAD